MKFAHYYCLKAPLMLVAYIWGNQDPAFLIVAVLSALAVPLFFYLGE